MSSLRYQHQYARNKFVTLTFVPVGPGGPDGPGIPLRP